MPQPIHKILEINQRDEVALKIPFSHKAWVPHPFRVFCGMGGKPRIIIARALYQDTASKPVLSAAEGCRHPSKIFWKSISATKSRPNPTLPQTLGAPSIPRLLRNGWETTNLHSTGFASGHDFKACPERSRRMPQFIQNILEINQRDEVALKSRPSPKKLSYLAIKNNPSSLSDRSAARGVNGPASALSRLFGCWVLA